MRTVVNLTAGTEVHDSILPHTLTQPLRGQNVATERQNPFGMELDQLQIRQILDLHIHYGFLGPLLLRRYEVSLRHTIAALLHFELPKS